MLSKKGIILLLLVLCCQRMVSQVKMGVIAGPSVTGNTLNNVQIGVINPSAPCFCGVKLVQSEQAILYSAGFTLDYKLSDEFFIVAKALFGAKGWNEKVHYADFNPGSSAVTYDSKDKYRFHYFEVPLYFMFSASIGNKGARFNAGIGGYIDFELQGKYSFHLVRSQNITGASGYLTENAFEDGVPVLKDSQALIAVNPLQKKLTNYGANFIDMGISALVSLEFENNLHVDLSFLSGLKNILTNGFYPFPRTNRSIGLGLSVGYYFNKN